MQQIQPNQSVPPSQPLNQSAEKLKPRIYLIVRTHEEILFEGEVHAFTSYNAKGTFDVLPQHANFISLVERYLRIDDINGKSREFPVTNGLLRVKEGRIEVYMGIKR